MDDMTGTTFGERLREKREQLGLTLQAMAAEIADHGVDVSHQNVSKWERDEARPTKDKLEAIAKAYDLPLPTVAAWYLGDAGRSDTDERTPNLHDALAHLSPHVSRGTLQAIEMLVRADQQQKRRDTE